MRDFMVRALGHMGHSCDVATNGIECLARCEQAPPDLIFLDLVMPIMDGMSTLKELRTKHPDVEVVVASVQDDDLAVHELLAQGATAYLCKPFTAQQLAQLVEQIWAKRSAR